MEQQRLSKGLGGSGRAGPPRNRPHESDASQATGAWLDRRSRRSSDYGTHASLPAALARDLHLRCAVPLWSWSMLGVLRYVAYSSACMMSCGRQFIAVMSAGGPSAASQGYHR